MRNNEMRTLKKSFGTDLDECIKVVTLYQAEREFSEEVDYLEKMLIN